MATIRNRTPFSGLMATLMLAISVQAQETETVELQVGDPAPDFGATDDQGQVWRSADRAAGKYAVVYFSPGDFTGGCSRQAESFRDQMTALAKQGVEVIGVSGDTVETHRLFKDLYQLNFRLLSDAEGRIARQFGVPFRKGGKARVKFSDGKVCYRPGTRDSLIVRRGATLDRQTFIISPNGMIVDKNIHVDPLKESRRVLERVAALQQ